MIAEEVSIPFTSSQLRETIALGNALIDKWGRHPLFVRMARRIAGQARAKTRAEEAKAIWSHVKKVVTYRKDPVSAEWVQDPFETLLVSRAGDCDDMAVACGALLGAIGHDCAMVAVQWVGRENPSHAVCIDKSIGKVVDAVAPRFEPWPPSGRVVKDLVTG